MLRYRGHTALVIITKVVHIDYFKWPSPYAHKYTLIKHLGVDIVPFALKKCPESQTNNGDIFRIQIYVSVAKRDDIFFLSGGLFMCFVIHVLYVIRHISFVLDIWRFF